MKGLLLKDFYMLISYCRMVFIVMILLMGIAIVGHLDSNLFILGYPNILAAMLPMSLVAYDEKEKWCIYSQTLPVSKAQYVSAKYIMGLILIFLAFLLSSGAFTVKQLINGNFSWADYVGMLEFAAGGMIASAVLMPFIFKFGSEKGRIVYFMILIAFFATFFVISNVDVSLSLVIAITINPGILVFLVGIFLYLLSWWISVSLYEKREL